MVTIEGLQASVLFLAGEIDKMDKEMEDVIAVCAMLAAIVNAQGETITRLTAVTFPGSGNRD